MNENLTFKEKIELLQKPFPKEVVKWRLSQTFKKSNGSYGGMCYCYIDNRAIQERLDEIFGPFGWKNVFKEWHEKKPQLDSNIILNAFSSNGKLDNKALKDFLDNYYCQSQLCGISIFDEEKKEWITKWDGSESRAIASVKSGLSDSMKRVGSQWGIGRYLYDIPNQFVQIYPNKKNVPLEQNFYGKIGGIYVKNHYWEYPDIEKILNNNNGNNYNNNGNNNNYNNYNNYNNNDNDNDNVNVISYTNCTYLGFEEKISKKNTKYKVFHILVNNIDTIFYTKDFNVSNNLANLNINILLKEISVIKNGNMNVLQNYSI